MQFIKVKNNLYEIRTNKKAYLINYDSVICEVDIDNDNILIDYNNAFSSATTRKGLYDFLGIDKKTILKLIDEGRILLFNCNDNYLLNAKTIARGAIAKSIAREALDTDEYNKNSNKINKEFIRWAR